MNTPDRIQRAAVELLHFHPNWFAYGMLPLDFFEQQLQKYQKVLEYRKEDDTFWDNAPPQVYEDLFWGSLEHHRYCALRTVLSSRERFSDLELEQYIELCQLDEDETMGRSALVNLLSWPSLTDAQYDKITKHAAFSDPVAEKIIWRNQMHAELLSNSISEAVFAAMLERQDPVFERDLVASDSISAPQLEVLAEKGVSRAVRNIAKSRLKRRK